MTEIMDKINPMNNTGLVHVGASNKSEYLKIYSKKRKRRWDENFKSCKNILSNLDIRNSRKTRWGAEYEKTFTPLPVTKIPEDTDIDSFEILIRKNRLEDVNRRLQCNDWENVDPDIRSPSPEPIYDSKTGHRLNIREVRNKEKYIKEKNSLIEELILLDSNYKPPRDYRPPKKTMKVFINEADNEKHKLIGLILGPHGVTQKELEKKSGCRISVRGKGSNWSNNSMDKTYHDESEPLHVFFVADTEENIRKGMALVQPILDPFSEEHLKHKQMQKNAVAVMYGYQTETSCENCGERHRTWACPNNFGNFTKVDVKCAVCQDKSHPTCDCPERGNIVDKQEEENDLYKFIKEIDEFKKNAEILVLEAERKADDIRDSVLFTGKIPETTKDDAMKGHGVNEINYNHNNNNSQEQRQGVSYSQGEDYQFNQFMSVPGAFDHQQQQQYPSNINMINQYANMNNMNNMNNYIRPPPLLQPQQGLPLDYKLPMIPIVDNPNVIRAQPVNYTNQTMPMMGGLNAPGNNYYMNPLLFPQNNKNNNMPIPMTYPSMQSNQYQTSSSSSFHYNRGLNFISSNFQGKIPKSYGMNLMNFAARPQNNMGVNMNIHLPNGNFNRINNVNNGNMIRPVSNNMGNVSYVSNGTYQQPGMNNEQMMQPPEPQEPEPSYNNLNGESDDIQIEKA